MATGNTNTEIALLKQETQYIKETVMRVEKGTTEWMARLEKKQDEQHNLLYNMMKEMRDSFPEKFVTRPEHEDNEKRIKELEDDKKAIIKWIILSFVWIILTLAWISKYFL